MMSFLQGHVLQCRRLNPNRYQDKNNVTLEQTKHKADVYKNHLNKSTKAIIEQHQELHQKKSLKHISTSNVHLGNEAHVYSSKISNRKMIFPESKIRKTVQRRVHFRYMEPGSVEFIDGPMSYNVDQSAKSKMEKKSNAPLKRNAIHYY